MSLVNLFVALGVGLMGLGLTLILMALRRPADRGEGAAGRGNRMGVRANVPLLSFGILIDLIGVAAFVYGLLRVVAK